jgi:hypothetical protein
MTAKRKRPESNSVPATHDDNFHLRVFEVLADLQLEGGVPLHQDAMRQQLWYKLHLRKGQARFFINRLIARGWVVPDRGRGLFMNESMMAYLEEKRRIKEQWNQASLARWEPIMKGLEESLINHWRGMGQ